MSFNHMQMEGGHILWTEEAGVDLPMVMGQTKVLIKEDTPEQGRRMFTATRQEGLLPDEHELLAMALGLDPTSDAGQDVIGTIPADSWSCTSIGPGVSVIIVEDGVL